MSVEATPAFLRSVDQFEHKSERGRVRGAALVVDRTVAHGGEGALDGVRGAQIGLPP